jgi:hypothetical protein
LIGSKPSPELTEMPICPILRAMNQTNDETVFEILGYELRLKQEEADHAVAPAEVIELVQREADLITENSPHLDRGKVALLVALKLASSKLSLEKEFSSNIQELQTTARDALHFIEELVPKAH